MVEVSVITCTVRVSPGIEDILSSLDVQTFKDFEYILVDAKLDKIPGRREQWEAERKRHTFPIKVVGDKPMPYKLGLANARNSGLIWADGRIIVYIDDLTSFGSDLLALHMQHHVPNKRPTAVAGIGHYVFPDQVIVDQRIAICKHPTGPVESRPEWLYGMNASFPLEQALALNGSDERYCGEYGGEDCDFSIRLHRNGVRMILDPRAIVREVRDGTRHNDIFDTEGVAHEDWWNKRTGKFHWRNEKFTDEVVYEEPKRVVSKNPYSLRQARANRLAGATTWEDILKGA